MKDPLVPDGSPDGRRVLVAVVSGEAGQRIQSWREEYDPAQARRLPPHVTLCYWAGGLDAAALERQVRHAVDEPVAVQLGCAREFDNREHTIYIDVLDTAPLDEARRRLYDGVACTLPPLHPWTWHVTCVRDTRGRDLDSLRAAAKSLTINGAWAIDTVAWLELHGDRYESLATWTV